MSIDRFIRFTNDAGGLEKILRFLQSFSHIAAAYSSSAEQNALWTHLKIQFVLGRRYFRFFRFLPCFQKTHELLLTPTNLTGVLEMGKWSFMGMYLFLETVTILDAIGVWRTQMANVCMLEANRFWFCSLLCSISYRAVLSWSQASVQDGDTSETGSHADASGHVGKKEIPKSRGGKFGIAADCFDLLIPGHIIGWIPTSTVFTSFAGIISTLLSSKEIWDRL